MAFEFPNSVLYYQTKVGSVLTHDRSSGSVVILWKTEFKDVNSLAASVLSVIVKITMLLEVLDKHDSIINYEITCLTYWIGGCFNELA